MRTLIIADVHANLPALEAVLATPQAQTCDRIISLGDQVNFGPQPREVMQRLTELHALMLRGNHEDRLLRVDAPEFAGYNWDMQRWTYRQLQGIQLNFPADCIEGCKLFTHGTPGNPFHLIEPNDVPDVLDTLPEGITHMFSGHNHVPWMVTHNGRVSFNPGSLGMLEDNIGSAAAFAIMEENDVQIQLTQHRIPYDTTALKRAFITSGCAAYAPEMTRIVLHVMLSGENAGQPKFLQHIAAQGNLADIEAWHRADHTWPWREPLSTADYWKKLEEELL